MPTEVLTRSETAAGKPSIAAESVVKAPADEVFSFLSDLENHWLLAFPFIEVVELDRPEPEAAARGGRVRVRGPLGLRRTALTRVIEVEAPRRMAGTAEVGPETRARVSWTLTPAGGTTLVRLDARIERATALDRMLLALGGAAWMRRRFAAILERLGERVVG